MAIAKMNLVNIIGRADDFDRVCAKYLLDCDMHIENAVGALDNIAGLTPYSDEDSYSDLIARVEAVYNRAGFCRMRTHCRAAERTTNKRWRKSMTKCLRWRKNANRLSGRYTKTNVLFHSLNRFCQLTM